MYIHLTFMLVPGLDVNIVEPYCMYVFHEISFSLLMVLPFELGLIKDK